MLRQVFIYQCIIPYKFSSRCDTRLSTVDCQLWMCCLCWCNLHFGLSAKSHSLLLVSVCMAKKLLQAVKACLTCIEKSLQEVGQRCMSLKSRWIYVSPPCFSWLFSRVHVSYHVFLQTHVVTVCICMCVILIVALSLLLSSVRRVCFVLTYGASAVYLHFN